MEEPTIKHLSANLRTQYAQIVTRQATWQKSVTANNQCGLLLLYWLAKLPANIIAEELAQRSMVNIPCLQSKTQEPQLLTCLPANIIAEEPAQKEHDENPLFTIQDTRATATNMDPIHVTMSLNGNPIPMEIDTGAAVSILTETKFMEFSSEEL